MDTIELCQAKFILNALKDGWTVHMKADGELEFAKERENHMAELDYSKKFLEKYGNLDTQKPINQILNDSRKKKKQSRTV